MDLSNKISLAMKLFTATLITVFGVHAFAAKYMITMKDTKTFQSVAKATSAANKNAAVNFLSASTKIENSLKHLNMFIVDTDEDITYLADNPNILAVEKDILFPAPPTVSTFSSSSFLSYNIEIEQPAGIETVGAPSAWSVTEGENIKVLVIDSGIDKDHPAVADNFVEGINFMSRLTEENAPYDYFDDIGHGTHVAGTVLGTTVGVAQEAELYVARVCSASGCSPMAIASAVNWGIENEVDVMNLSLGGNRVSAMERFAFLNAEAQGITVVSASGNSGEGSISFPAKLNTVIAVGALNEDLSRADFSQYGDGLFITAPGVNIMSSVPLGTGRLATTLIDLGDGFKEVESNSFLGATALEQNIELEMVYVGLGKEADYEGIDLTGKIALIERGEIRFLDKVNGAIAVGAAAVIIFNNEDGLTGGSLTEDGTEVGIPVVMVEQSIGKNILTKIADKSFAPRADVFIAKTDYGPQQGTSMASPHVAGCVALILGANPDLSPAQVRDIIAKTATDVGSFDEYGHGLINVAAAVEVALETEGDQVVSEPVPEVPVPALAIAN